jgi:hypothetical protein
MMIPVIYYDNSRGMIESWTLSRLIREGGIKAFKRSSGWVHVGTDPIRKSDYSGMERDSGSRKHENFRPHTLETGVVPGT